MNAGPFATLISEFDKNWRAHAPALAMASNGSELELAESHPLLGEISALCSGGSSSLPFFSNKAFVVWCTLAPDSYSLRQAVAQINAWIIPSLGGPSEEDGYVEPDSAKGGLASLIKEVSSSGYFKWRCSRDNFDEVVEKFRLFRNLEAVRPPRPRPPRPSLYELRARFVTALLIGDRDKAEETIQFLDSLQLETAVNTQFMRIRMWHYFREFDKIRSHPDLAHLLAQSIPSRVRSWIDEAIGVETEAENNVVESEALPPPVTDKPGVTTDSPVSNNWLDWFECVIQGNREGAEVFVQERPKDTEVNLPPSTVLRLVECIEELYLDSQVRSRERGIILDGISNLLEDFVLEPHFPRPSLGDFYFALLQLWGALYGGNSAGQEHGNVLLELASAVLKLNRDQDSVIALLEDWWKARPTPSQLPYALDAIELLERESTNKEATANLWLSAATLMLRSRDELSSSDKQLWRKAGMHLGFTETDIAQYLPHEEIAVIQDDPLTAAHLSHIAIVCLREQQANEAAKAIKERTTARVTVVASPNASSETKLALSADVVLFVWMASTHAVFRAFDSYDRKRFCYVQGTGASSIVRTLERWVAASYSSLSA